MQVFSPTRCYNGPSMKYLAYVALIMPDLLVLGGILPVGICDFTAPFRDCAVPFERCQTEILAIYET